MDDGYIVVQRMKIENATSSNSTASHRVLVWWDVDINIGPFHKRKLTSRPLKELERALGHRLHVEGRWRHDKHAPDVWKFEAFNYLDTDDPALAACFILSQSVRLSEWLVVSWHGFNAAATTAADDLDASTICAFYWSPPDQIGMTRYISSGVQLNLVDIRNDVPDRFRRLARPVVKIPAASLGRNDYLIQSTAHILCDNRRDLLDMHLPRLPMAEWADGMVQVDVDALTSDGTPNIIRIQHTLNQVCEHEAIAHVLSLAQGFRIKMSRSNRLLVLGERPARGEYSDGIVSFEMTQVI
ncbi:hypothetical protein [Hyphomicrobium sp. D-2]|uniref:hypothetical protein n=1 Tax=Hyphomicrobium sp. D-2 TaxID=3041621 RepID=UPI0024551F7B|nr:hypothetical protein [Hyphomicrobium sp. D-2]MDH4983447.1 hypothetical protein [Hyphomicrobium sp. D-2]